MFTPSPSLTIRTIGGILDFYFIVDDTSEQVNSLQSLFVNPIVFIN